MILSCNNRIAAGGFPAGTLARSRLSLRCEQIGESNPVLRPHPFLVAGFNHLEQSDFVSWKDDIPN
jgi:hypothetical protein